MPESPSRVLLVEDNPGDAELIAELIAEGDGPPIRLIHAVRLSDACSRLEREDVDVVILDLSLPDAHGLDSVRRMHAAAPAVPVVVLTSHDDQATALAAVHAGAQDYLVKGEDDGRVIRRALRYAVERQRLVRERAELLRSEREARHLAESERARAEVAWRTAVDMERRATFLAAAGAELLAALDPQATLATLASLLVPTLASRAATFLVQGDALLPVACVGAPATPGAPELPDPLSPEAVAARVHDLLASGAGAPEAPRAPPGGAPLTLPLHARGQVVAVLVAEPGREQRWGEAELRLLRDLADRAALAVDNGRSFDAARRAVAARDQMMGVVSHDLRNPISAVIMCAESLVAAPPPTPAEVVRLGELVRDSASWMQRIIRDLLDVTAIDAGQLALSPQPITAESVLERILTLHEPIARERDVVLECRMPSGDEGSPLLHADPDRLVQAAGNLVANAVKFSPRGGRVRLELETVDEEIVFHVRDRGAGIAAEHLPFIFDRFWQVRETRRAGAGLGLAI
ncbi:MAG TPA: response regulator, partial [Gemmatimonadaceae bacterium]|nr:response regulator [Gemmatimonadaceae bacterium]